MPFELRTPQQGIILSAAKATQTKKKTKILVIRLPLPLLFVGGGGGSSAVWRHPYPLGPLLSLWICLVPKKLDRDAGPKR
jgi:hypothetical protein